MEKVTKNIITRESIEKDLRFDNKGDLYKALFVLGIWLFVLLPLSLFIMSISGQESSTLYSYFIIAIFCFLNFLLLVLGAVLLTGVLTERKMLTKGEYEIEKMFLHDKLERIVPRGRGRYRKAYYLIFKDFKKFEVTSQVYENSTHYDEFYVIHYKNKKTVKLIFNVNTNEYKER